MQTKKTVIRYSEAFKAQVLNEIESGALSFSRAQRKYGITGGDTIKNWAKKSGRFGIVPKIIRVENPKERDKAKVLTEENKRLKAALADVILDQKIAESTLEVICEQQGWDIEEIKKSWHAIAEKTISKEEKVIRVCARLNKSRAAFYKQMKKDATYKLQDQVVSEMVMEKRNRMPRLGGKKLYILLKPDITAHQIQMGRDKFFAWLRKYGLLVKPKKSFTKTTNSHHRFRVHQNLIKNTPVTRPNQIWVSDITYLRLQKGFCYLALITDAFSRKIVGFDVSNSLELSGCLRALKQAAGSKNWEGLTHHSDRGLQYCSNPYVGVLRESRIQISMAEAGNCYENALAERINGILKNEFNLDAVFTELKQAQRAVHQAIKTYNEERPHMSLGMRKPNELYAA